MSLCRHTETLLDATFESVGLARPQSDHAATCSECARALAEARRFEAALHTVGLEVAPEPMPPLAEVTAATSYAPRRRKTMTLRHTFIGGAAATAIVAVFGAVNLLAPLIGSPASPATSPDQLNAWLDAALVEALETGGRHANPAEWQAYQVEVCGAHAIAFFTERDPSGVRPFRWAIGEPNAGARVTATGISGTLFEADVARRRAVMPVCSRFVDPSLGERAALDALEQARARQADEMEAEEFERGPITFRELDLRDARVVDMSPISRETYRVLAERPDGIRTWLVRYTLSVEDESAWIATSSTLESGVTRSHVVYRDAATTVPTYFGLIDDESIVALELIGADERLRYPVDAPGFILEGDLPSHEVHDYRFLDGAGRVVAEGDISGWPPSR